jgi:hypothetical protein
LQENSERNSLFYIELCILQNALKRFKGSCKMIGIFANDVESVIASGGCVGVSDKASDFDVISGL